MIRFAVDGVTSFSHVPLRLVTLAGFAASAGSAVLLAWAFYVKFVAHRTVQGWTSLIAVVLLMGGAQFFICFGVFKHWKINNPSKAVAAAKK
jgi:dolichol-phosphate mannosyltransferase